MLVPIAATAYLAIYAVPLLLPLAWWLGVATGHPDLAAFLPLIFLQGILPILDLMLGENRVNLSEEQAAVEANRPVYRWITLAAVPVQFAVLAWATWFAATGGLGIVGLVGWILSTGYVGAVIAINIGHELVHKRSTTERTAGGILLSTVCYGGFKVEHVRGHHVNVSTPEDASSARLGQSLFAFIPQAIVRNSANAWRLEARRLEREGRRWWHWRNELWYWHGLSLLWAGLATLTFGPMGLAFFLGQSLMAIVSLETINYVEHYGLERRKLPSGRYERPDPTHSWNSDAVLTNVMLLQLARHSDHHANATRRYQVLRHFDESPQLPAGYAAMFVLAWIPPLWRRIMDPRARAYRERRPLAEASGRAVPAA